MKTIYKQPREYKPKVNEVKAIKFFNSTGTLRRVEGTRYDLIVSYNTPIAYVVDVEEGSFINNPKLILCNEFYSMTTRKHQAKIKDYYQNCATGLFDLGGFKTRAAIDGVDVRGGQNGGTNINWLHA